MIDIPITRIQLLAPPEIRENRKCNACAFHYVDVCGNGCKFELDSCTRSQHVNIYKNLDYKIPPCKMNFTPEEMKVILADVHELELFFKSYSNGIEYVTIGENGLQHFRNSDGGSYEQ